MDCMEEMAALSLLVTLRECRQLGTALTPTQGSQYLQSHILPHQNRMAIRNRTEEISAQLQNALAKSGAPGVRSEAEKNGRSPVRGWNWPSPAPRSLLRMMRMN